MSVRPAAAAAAASCERSGQGASGLTWSGVTGETPPKSSMPASSRRGNSAWARFGGAWIATSSGISRRATAIVQRWSSSVGSGASAIFVPGLARKFWTMISWRCPWRSCSSRSASSASTRSLRVSPMPIRMPLVYGIASRPARSIASRRTSGSLSGEPKCASPRCDSRALAVSSMMPCEALTSRSASSSSSSRMPGLACGRRPVSRRTRPAQCARYAASSGSRAARAPRAPRGSAARACRRA